MTMTAIIRTTLLVLLLSSPAAAQDGDAPPPPGDPSDITEGVDLLSEGARRLLRGLMGEVEPQMRELADALEKWNFEGLDLDDLGAYEPPEMLPNGDIIIRRKDSRPVDRPMDNEIDL